MCASKTVLHSCFLSPCSMLLKFLEHEIPVPAAPAVKAHTFSLTTLNLISEKERPPTTCPEKTIAPTACQTVTFSDITRGTILVWALCSHGLLKAVKFLSNTKAQKDNQRTGQMDMFSFSPSSGMFHLSRHTIVTEVVGTTSGRVYLLTV